MLARLAGIGMDQIDVDRFGVLQWAARLLRAGLDQGLPGALPAQAGFFMTLPHVAPGWT